MTDTLDQPPLFDIETPPVRRAHAALKDGSTPTWSRYQPKKPVKCDDCLTVLFENLGEGPATRNARWRRRAGAVDRLLCFAHAQQRRQDDDLPALKGQQ